VGESIDQALAALKAQPPTLGAALLATESALGRVHWDKGLEPKDWAAARDQVLDAYALTLDARPGAAAKLAEAEKVLAALPDGNRFARRLAGLQTASAPSPVALAALVSDLDAKVRSLRDAAELSH
jgi:hypothetical protein